MRHTPYRLARNLYQRLFNRPYWREREQVRGFYRQFVRPGDLVFDIGAHNGRLSEALVELGCRVVAVEPNPALTALMRRRYGSYFTVVPQAVGPERGQLTLYLGEHSCCSTVSPEWRERASPHYGFGGEVVVEATTLADLIAEHGEPAFVKIDVEGFEAAVLAGLDRPLRSLSFEFQCLALDTAETCLLRLDALASFAYAHTLGEEKALASEWLTGDGLSQRLAELRDADELAYGDVLALRTA